MNAAQRRKLEQVRKLAGELAAFAETAGVGADRLFDTASIMLQPKYGDSPAARRRAAAMPSDLRAVGEVMVAMTERFDALMKAVIEVDQ